MLCVPPLALWVVSVWRLWSRFSLSWIERDRDRKRQRRGDIDRLLEWACCVSVSYSLCILTFHQPTASVKGYDNSQPFGTVKTKRFNIVLILKLLLNANVFAFLPCSHLSLQLLFLTSPFPFLSWISAFVCLILWVITLQGLGKRVIKLMFERSQFTIVLFEISAALFPKTND